MARPRVILACDSAEAAIQLGSSLDERRYRVENSFDLSEALLRAQLVMAHTVVVHAPHPDMELQRRLAAVPANRFTVLVVSPDRRGLDVARAVGAAFLREPYEQEELRSAVFATVARARDVRRQQHVRRAPSPSGARAPQRVLILSHNLAALPTISAVLHSQLGTSCVPAASVEEALARIEEAEIDCVVADPAVLCVRGAGAQLARRLVRESVSVVALGPHHDTDDSAAAEVAWQLVPQVRRAMEARERLRGVG